MAGNVDITVLSSLDISKSRKQSISIACDHATTFRAVSRGRGAPQREHHLNTVKRSPDAQNENWLNSIARKRPTKTPCSLFAIDSPIPKLDVAGSTPVSRSKINNLQTA
jgi:hypothetical protein